MVAKIVQIEQILRCQLVINKVYHTAYQEASSDKEDDKYQEGQYRFEDSDPIAITRQLFQRYDRQDIDARLNNRTQTEEIQNNT